MKLTMSGMLGLTMFLVCTLITPSLATNNLGVTDSAVGLYTDPSVANQVATFTVNPTMVACGVGTVNNFEMLMYSLSVDSYDIDRTNKIITAGGRMRSITRVAGLVVEDVEHDFVAIAVDNTPPEKDYYALHFRTDFWNTDNPLCTVSTKLPDSCMFGGDVFLGGVSVASKESP